MAPDTTLHLRLDASEFEEWSQGVVARLLELEPDLARKVQREFLSRLVGHPFRFRTTRLSSTPGADDNIVRFTLTGLDELFAAAMAAAKGEGDLSHGGSTASVD